jgi:hypothetical protein
MATTSNTVLVGNRDGLCHKPVGPETCRKSTLELNRCAVGRTSSFFMDGMDRFS